MPDNRRQPRNNRRQDDVVRQNLPGDDDGDYGFAAIEQPDEDAPAHPANTDNVGRAHVAAADFENIHAFAFGDDIAGRNRANQVAEDRHHKKSEQ